MSTPVKSTDNPTKSSSGAESPTTVRPLELDDDDVQESGVLLGGDAPAAPKPATVEDAPPAKPPRPLNAQQQAENTLKEAFPTIDIAVVKAVLIASGGRVEPAFNALLGMSDPDAVIEPTPPPQPPRPTAQHPPGYPPKNQLEADEQYARQLAEHYDGGGFYGPRTSSSSRGGAYARGQPHAGYEDEPYEENRSFIDDDLPIIKENLRKGFLETQSKVNGWITNLKKRIDGEDEDDISPPHSYGTYSNAQYRPRRSGDGRGSSDYNRYDADPQVLSDDFAGIQMNEDGAPARRSTRPLANPDLFKPTPLTPKSSNGRKVSFQDGPPEDMELYRSAPKTSGNSSSAGKQSKWQPLSSVEPNPAGDADNDPFSLGDSEDEKETKDRVGGKEAKTDDAERLKKAAAEAMADSIGEPEAKPEATETGGAKDKVAEEATGKS